MPLIIAIPLIILAFVAGALAFRKNPVTAAKTLAELDTVYAAAKAKLGGK
jgi:hypothetical protein